MLHLISFDFLLEAQERAGVARLTHALRLIIWVGALAADSPAIAGQAYHKPIPANNQTVRIDLAGEVALRHFQRAIFKI